jgi:CTP-dependent riboflavin kinase
MDETVLHGIVASGVGAAARFTDVPWVWRQFAEKLELHVWPGTFNVLVTDSENQRRWAALGRRPGVEIEPEEPGVCVAHCYPVLVNDWIRGAIVLPHVPDYPADQIEIVAAEHVRAGLGLSDGDAVTIRVLDATGEADTRLSAGDVEENGTS